MADSLTTLAKLIKLNDRNLAPDFASDLLLDAPLLARMQATAANASNGTQHKYLKHTTAPTVGFRPVNTGIDYAASDQTLVTVDLKQLSANPRIDQQLANAYDMGPEALMDLESMLAMQAALNAAEKQIIYGTGAAGSADGFTGISQATTIDALADPMVVTATGTTALTSVYLLRFGPADVELIMGRGGNIMMGDTFSQMIADGSGRLFPAFCRIQEALMSVKVGSAFSLGRICNIGVAAGKTLTDALIYSALSKFPAGRRPSLLVMNTRSQEQLRSSRTATNPTGAPAPTPEEVGGVPILVTDSIRNDETAVA
jgi:hypothetical protein